MLQNVKEVNRAHPRFSGVLIARYGGWCEAPPFNQTIKVINKVTIVHKLFIFISPLA